MDAMTELAKAFDYGELPEPEIKAMERHAERLSAIRDSVAQSAIETGRILSEARDRLASRRTGTFEQWVEQRCGMTPQHARRFINVSEQFGSKPNIDVRFFDDTAMFLLAAPSCPEKARKEAERLAEQGKRVTAKAAKE